MTQAVFFDLFETLVTEFVADGQTRPSIAERLGLAPAAFAAAWQARQHERMCGIHLEYSAVLRDICQELAQPVDEDLLQRLAAERVAAKAVPFDDIEPAIVQMLQHLHKVGLRLGVVSNCTPEEVTAWPTCLLAAYVDVVVFSYQVGYAKPEAEIYHLACRQLDVAPAQASFVGDGGSDELNGAAQAGLTAYWATWFLDRWPAWKRTGHDHQQHALYPQLRRPTEAMKVLVARSGPAARSRS